MKIEALDIEASESDGTVWAITMAWNPTEDIFGITWHKMLSGFQFSDLGYIPRTFEDTLSLAADDSLPGCITSTVQVLINREIQRPRGIRFCGISKYPLLPNGNTLLGYIDLLKKFPGFETVERLIGTLGRNEDFLAGIPIHTDIEKRRDSLAA